MGLGAAYWPEVMEALEDIIPVYDRVNRFISAGRAGRHRAAGVAGADDIAPAQKAALYRMETEQGDEFWLALHDFYVITRYNRSAMYALAVLQLSEAIRQRFASQAEGASPAER